MNEQTKQLPSEGEKLGSGIVVGIIGAGGSATVFKTWVEKLELNRAVKVMSPGVAGELRGRFATEAKISCKLIHQNIVQVINSGETTAGFPYIEMEFIGGPTLEAVIAQKGALPAPVALAVATGVLEALHHAHNINYTLYGQQHRGIMHRDIKPANVMISDGVPKLMDFGIARPVAVSIHTAPGHAPGTAAYMAPEVCTKGDCDFRSDIYQIGLLLYECIGGKIAYPQKEIKPLVMAITAGERKPLNTNSKAAAIIKKCLEIDPNKRYQTAQECLADVRALYHILSPQTTPEERLLAFMQGAEPTKSKKRTSGGTSKALKIAVIAVPCVLFVLILAVTTVHYAPIILQTLIDRAALLAPATPPPAQAAPEPKTDSARAAQAEPAKTVAPAAAKKPTTPAAAPVAAKTASAPLVPPAPEPTPEDALYHIRQGKILFAGNKPLEALTSFQTAIKTPSASMPKQEVIKQSLLGSAQCNTVLYLQNKVSRGTFETSWRNVQNAFGAGSPEHTEALRHLETIQ